MAAPSTDIIAWFKAKDIVPHLTAHPPVSANESTKPFKVKVANKEFDVFFIKEKGYDSAAAEEKRVYFKLPAIFAPNYADQNSFLFQIETLPVFSAVGLFDKSTNTYHENPASTTAGAVQTGSPGSAESERKSVDAAVKPGPEGTAPSAEPGRTGSSTGGRTGADAAPAAPPKDLTAAELNAQAPAFSTTFERLKALKPYDSFVTALGVSPSGAAWTDVHSDAVKKAAEAAIAAARNAPGTVLPPFYNDLAKGLPITTGDLRDFQSRVAAADAGVDYLSVVPARATQLDSATPGNFTLAAGFAVLVADALATQQRAKAFEVTSSANILVPAPDRPIGDYSDERAFEPPIKGGLTLKIMTFAFDSPSVRGRGYKPHPTFGSPTNVIRFKAADQSFVRRASEIRFKISTQKGRLERLRTPTDKE